MSNETPARILKVTIEGPEEGRVIKAPADTRSVKVEFEGGRLVEVNADGGFTFTAADGRTVTVNGDGEVQADARPATTVRVHGKTHDVTIRGGVQGAQFGSGNMQTNVW